jgi:hypothetical protein
MSATIAEARDEILTHFSDAWLANSLTQDIPVEYDDRVGYESHDAATTWLRVSVKHNPALFGQSSLTGEVGTRRFSRFGIAFIQIFVPVNDGLDQTDKIIQMLLDTFEGARTPNGIRFRNVGATEQGVSGAWQQSNVTANFSYDQIK